MVGYTLTRTFAQVFADATDADKDQAQLWGAEQEAALNALFSSPVLINGKLVASVAANALTIAIKTLAGNDPSASDPVYVVFRDPTVTLGALTLIRITAANSFTVSATATLGFTNSVPGRIWVVLFNDAGTPRIGVVNLYSTGVLYPLDESGVASATNGAGNSAGVIYAGAAVASKAYRVIGFVTYETALATAGTYSAAPDVVTTMQPGVPLPGRMVQRQRTASGATASGTTTVPLDNTIPQNTEGDQYFSQAITPLSKANRLRVKANLMLSNTAAVHIIAALFQDTTADALAAMAQITSANGNVVILLEYLMIAGTVASTTFKIRAGGSGAGTTRLNGSSGAQLFNGVAASFLEIEEIM